MASTTRSHLEPTTTTTGSRRRVAPTSSAAVLHNSNKMTMTSTTTSRAGADHVGQAATTAAAAATSSGCPVRRLNAWTLHDNPLHCRLEMRHSDGGSTTGQLLTVSDNAVGGGGGHQAELTSSHCCGVQPASSTPRHFTEGKSLQFSQQ